MIAAGKPNPFEPVSRAFIGLGLGLLLGLCDLLVLQLIGVEMRYGDVDMTFPVMGVFTLTFGALGHAIGRVTEARTQARADAQTIREQLDELERSQRQLLEYEKLASIGRMAAGVAHEVRNPLGVIKSSAALLVECVDPAETDAIKAGRFISLEIDRLDGFIRALLDFSRPLAPERRPVTARELAARIDELGRAPVEAVRASLTVDIGGGPFEIDLDMVARAIATLIVNASQAVAAGGHVRVATHDHRDGHLELTVADDGPGVDDEVEDRIFEPFVTTKAKGTGLGLSMAQRIVEAHGGSVEHVAASGIGPDARGACFRLSIARPRARQAAA